MKVGFTNPFELVDTKWYGPGPLGITCTGPREFGKTEIKAGGAGLLTEFAVGECHGATKECETVSFTTEEHLPWTAELYKQGTEVRYRIVNGEAGPPRFIFRCRTEAPPHEAQDSCLASTSMHVTNNTSAGTVEAKFDAKSAKTTCIGELLGERKEAGEWKGTLTIKPPEGVEAIKAE
jgi:hypothetical protein